MILEFLLLFLTVFLLFVLLKKVGDLQREIRSLKKTHPDSGAESLSAREPALSHLREPERRESHASTVEAKTAAVSPAFPAEPEQTPPSSRPNAVDSDARIKTAVQSLHPVQKTDIPRVVRGMPSDKRLSSDPARFLADSAVKQDGKPFRTDGDSPEKILRKDGSDFSSEPLPDILPSGIMDSIADWLAVGEQWRPKNIPAEYAVAAVQLMRGAVLILLIGLAFVVQYVHEAGLFPPELRLIAGGILAVSVILAGIHLARKRYRVAGLGLAGLGFAFCYFLAFSGASVYTLISPGTAFAVAALTALAALAVSLSFGTQTIALIGLAGGFLAPILFDSGSRDLSGLFLWLALMGIGALAVAALRGWFAIQILSFFALWGYAFFALFSFCWDMSIVPLFLYVGMGFYLILQLQTLTHPLWKKMHVELRHSVLFLMNSCVAFLFLYLAMFHSDLMDRSRILLAYSLWNLGAIALLHYNFRSTDSVLKLMYAGVGSGAGVIACACYFSGNALPSVWSVYALILILVATRLRSAFLLFWGSLLVVLSGMSLFFVNANWYAFSWNLFGIRMGSYGVFVASLWCIFGIFRYAQEEKGFVPLSGAVALMMTFLYSSMEVYAFTSTNWPHFRGGLSIWWGIFALGILLTGLIRNARTLRRTAMILFLVTAGKILLLDQSGQETIYRVIGLIAVGLALLAGAVLYLRCAKYFDDANPPGKEASGHVE